MKIYKEKLTVVFLTLFALNIGLPIEVQAQDKTVNLSAAVGSQMMSKTSKMASVGQDLTQLYNEFETFSRMAGLYAAWHFKAGNRYLKVDGGYVTVDAVAAGDPAALKAELEALNMRGARSHGAYVSGRIPISAIPKMANSKNLKFARPAYFATNAGIVVSQGDAAMRADVARLQFDVDGTGITVGTMSDSFNCRGGAGSDVANGDLPADIIVLDDSFCPSGSDEGRAMMQLIADVAPGADQIFHTAFGGQANFAGGILDLANAGADVVVDDVIYFAEPMFQDGIIAQAVDTVVTNGVAYFSSAGNSSRQSYEAPFNPSGRQIFIGGSPAGEAHDFNPDAEVEDILQQITIPGGASLVVSFQWDSPYFSVSGNTGSVNDVDIFVVNSAGTMILAGSAAPNIGGDPVEILIFSNLNSSAGIFNLMIANYSGPNPGLLKYVIFNSSISIDEFDTASGTTFGHSNAVGAEAVAAAFFADTPEFGTDPAVLESFSSAGGVPLLFNAAGARLSSPEIRRKPEITAPDGTNTTFFGSRINDNDNFPNFFGTSAAAPHAAAVAALILEKDPSRLPAEVYTALEETALDMDDPTTIGFDSGFDFATGYGLIQADGALDTIRPPCPGDLDADGNVDANDLSIFAEAFARQDCGEDCVADLDLDEDVDGSDLLLLDQALENGCE